MREIDMKAAVHAAMILGLSITANATSGAASAQDAMRYYTFDGRDAVVTCGQGHVAGRPARTIYRQGRDWAEQDLRPTDASWVSSGCAGYIAGQSRPVSQEEFRQRMDRIVNPPPPDSFDTIMGRIVANLCKQNPQHRECG